MQGTTLGTMAALMATTLAAACGGATDGAPSGSAGTTDARSEKAVTANSVWRFAKLSNGAYFYTADENEKNVIVYTNPDMRYEGRIFAASAGAGSDPVFRFANTSTGGYFYTANAAERDLVLNDPQYSHFRYEGSSFAVESSASDSAYPIWRLANLENGGYLYTSNPAERDAAKAMGFWRDEGIVFYAGMPVSDDCRPAEFPDGEQWEQCTDLTKVPNINAINGRAFSGVDQDGSLCALGHNGSDVGMSINGQNYIFKLDGSTEHDRMVVFTTLPTKEMVVVHDPLSGRAIIFAFDSQVPSLTAELINIDQAGNMSPTSISCSTPYPASQEITE